MNHDKPLARPASEQSTSAGMDPARSCPFAKLLAIVTILTAVTAAAPRPSDILVIADVTPAGKEAPQASAERPVHYEPVWVGFRELGAVVAGERVPPAEAAKQNLSDALRKILHLPAGQDTPPPTVVVFFAWGTLYPDTVTTPGSSPDGQDETISFNSAQMLGFLGAHKLAKLPGFSLDKERVLAAAREDQYFLAVAAYDRVSLQQRKRKLLWMTRIATDSLRVWLPNVLPEMVASAAPFFGKDSDLPVWIDPNDRRKADVQIGTPEVREYLPDGAKKDPVR